MAVVAKRGVPLSDTQMVNRYMSYISFNVNSELCVTSFVNIQKKFSYQLSIQHIMSESPGSDCPGTTPVGCPTSPGTAESTSLKTQSSEARTHVAPCCSSDSRARKRPLVDESVVETSMALPDRGSVNNHRGNINADAGVVQVEGIRINCYNVRRRLY